MRRLPVSQIPIGTLGRILSLNLFLPVQDTSILEVFQFPVLSPDSKFVLICPQIVFEQNMCISSD